MAYKRISPMPIIEGGTNTQAFGTNFGTTFYDGTRLDVTATGDAGDILTSNGGGGMAPTYEPAGGGGGGSFFFASGGTGPSGFIAQGGVSTYSNVMLQGSAWGLVSNAGAFACPLDGTASNLFVYITANSSTIGVDFILQVNGVDSALAVTVTASTTGLFSNTVDSAAITAGDLLQFRSTGTAAFPAETIVGQVSCLFTP